MPLQKIKILLVISPFSQINTPYPSIGQLSGFLHSKGYQSTSLDLSLRVAKRIFSSEGLSMVFSARKEAVSTEDEFIRRMCELSENYIEVIDPVINFLQGKNPNLAYRIVKDGYLPQSEAFANQADEIQSFGFLGIQDRAKYYSSLMLDDLTKYISLTITPYFGLSRYAEKIAISPPLFDPLLKETQRKPNLIEEIIIEETLKAVKTYSPDLVGYSIPFPGNLLGALISAKSIKKNFPSVKIAFGGGYVNTELRKLKDKRVFNFTDYVTFDDGELPLLNIIKNISEEANNPEWVRTLLMNSAGELEYRDDASEKNTDHNEFYPPSLEGLEPGEYIPVVESLNPMHRLWSDGYWNKLASAHGCYWRKCTFCDITLDYIGRYTPARAAIVVDWMEEMIKQSGRTSFHFTDEAAPPSLLKEIALEILRRKLPVVWWGNIRFEKAFSRDLCRLLSLSGCIAVSGGLEVADERVLKLINKGVTLGQVARVCANFRDAGIMVHAYLMYGFPSQTPQEIINSLELVRQFVRHDLFQSGFFHRFSLTAHSPIAAEPEKYGLRIESSFDNPFANNDMQYADINGVDYGKFSKGLSKALYNYMHGIGLDWGLREWFDFKIPETTMSKDYIEKILAKDFSKDEALKVNSRVLWMAGKPVIKQQKGEKNNYFVSIHTRSAEAVWETSSEVAGWITEIYLRSGIDSEERLSFSQLKDQFPGGAEEFEKFSKTEFWSELRDNILLLI
ncbi:MAG: B12-binding domain-containing radical SAM protein [Bacillota bacterium]